MLAIYAIHVSLHYMQNCCLEEGWMHWMLTFFSLSRQWILLLRLVGINKAHSLDIVAVKSDHSFFLFSSVCTAHRWDVVEALHFNHKYTEAYGYAVFRLLMKMCTCTNSTGYHHVYKDMHNRPTDSDMQYCVHL